MDPIQSPSSTSSSQSPRVLDHKRHQFDDYRDTEATSNTSNSIRGNSSFSIDYILSNAAKKQERRQTTPDIDKRPVQQQRAQQKIDKIRQNALVDQLNIMNMNQQQAQLMANLQTISATQSQSQLTSAPPAAQTVSGNSYQNPLAQLLQQIGVNNRTESAAQDAFRMDQANSYFMACMLLHQYQQQQQQQANLIAGQQAAKMVSVAQQQQQRQQQQQHPANPSPIDSLALLARLTNTTATTNWPPTNPNLSFGAIEQSNIQGGGKSRTLGAQRVGASSPRRQPYTLSPVRQQQQQLPHTQLPPPMFAALPRCLGLKPQGSCNSGCPPAHSSLPSNQNFAKALSQDNQAAGATPTEQTSQQQQTVTRLSGSGGVEKVDNLKPAHSYIGLIAMCILSDRGRRMVLNDIYQYILDHYPYYRNRGSGWRNSVRHNLSLNECFQKAGRAANGKGHYWTIHPANMEDFMNGDFRRRRAQRKVRRYNNMDVPSDESDDESMEDATRPPLPEHFKQSIEMHKQLELEARMALMQDSSSVQQQLAEAANKQRRDMMARAAAMVALSGPLGAAGGNADLAPPTIVEHPATPVKDLLPVSQSLALAPPPRPLTIEPGPVFNGANQ